MIGGFVTVPEKNNTTASGFACENINQPLQGQAVDAVRQGDGIPLYW